MLGQGVSMAQIVLVVGTGVWMMRKVLWRCCCHTSLFEAAAAVKVTGEVQFSCSHWVDWELGFIGQRCP